MPKRCKAISPRTLATLHTLFDEHISPRWGKLQPPLVRGGAFEACRYTIDVPPCTRRLIGRSTRPSLKGAESRGVINAIARIGPSSRARIAPIALTLDVPMRLYSDDQSEW